MPIMNRLIPVLALLLALVAPAAAHAQTAPGCQFVLGFKTLHDMDPGDIGDCTDNQAFAANGDAQQHTTKGLMAWRKADNWTAFTNGYMTWINGPAGLVSRLNTQRFPWEADYQPSAPANQPACTGDAYSARCNYPNGETMDMYNKSGGVEAFLTLPTGQTVVFECQAMQGAQLRCLASGVPGALTVPDPWANLR